MIECVVMFIWSPQMSKEFVLIKSVSRWGKWMQKHATCCMKLTMVMPWVKQWSTNGSNVLKISQVKNIIWGYSWLSEELHMRAQYPLVHTAQFHWETWLCRVPRLLINDLLERANDNKNVLKIVITGDETWVYGYYIETSQQSSHCKSAALPCSKKAQQGAFPSTACFFFSIIEALCIMNLLLKVR